MNTLPGIAHAATKSRALSMGNQWILSLCLLLCVFQQWFWFIDRKSHKENMKARKAMFRGEQLAQTYRMWKCFYRDFSVNGE